MFRDNPALRNVLEGMLKGKKARGKPRLKYIKVIQNAGAENLTAI